MGKVKYTGPGPDALEIVLDAKSSVIAHLGETVEVPDDVAQRLTERPDFEPVNTKTEVKDDKGGNG